MTAPDPGAGTCVRCTSTTPPTVVTEGPGTNVTGTGTPATPYVVAAQLSAATGNTLSLEADGLFARPTFVDEGAGVDVTGTGTSVDPYTVAVDVSADADNALVIGVDGGLYVAAGGGGALGVNALAVQASPSDGSGFDALDLDVRAVGDSYVPLASVAGVDGEMVELNRATGVLVNPSDTQPMRLVARASVGTVELRYAGPDVSIRVETELLIAGDVTDSITARQSWRIDHTVDVPEDIDITGPDRMKVITLPPGGSIDLTVIGRIAVRSHSGAEIRSTFHQGSVWGGTIATEHVESSGTLS